MLESVEEAIKIANLALSKTAHIPYLDLSEGILIRLDMCYNHQVGDAVDGAAVFVGIPGGLVAECIHAMAGLQPGQVV